MIELKYSLNDIKEYVESFRYKLLSTEYIGIMSKLKLKCPEGHIFETRYNNFKNINSRCPECKGNRKHTLEKVKEHIESFDYKLLSTEYRNADTKLELKCPSGHIFDIKYRSFQQGQRCMECSGKRKHTLDEVKEYIGVYDYKVLSTEYINSYTKLKLQCPEGHIFNMMYRNFQQGVRCPECCNKKGWSKPEKEIAKYVKTIYSDKVIENDRTQIKNYWTSAGLELDIWLPEVKKAIEFNGSYWHSNNKTKWYDEMKKRQCMKNEIDLLVINEQDWYDDKMCQLNKINVFIGEM